MTLVRLEPRAVAKPWGRQDLPPAFDALVTGERIGEIWFEVPGQCDQPPLLIKHLFTSERLSIQVHPNDALAHSQGLPSGKNEAWFVMEAEPGATIGLGTRMDVDRDDLRKAALSGTIEELIDWRPVAAGDFHACPAGTIHAIGSGLKLIEIQQNVDITYRLYDYGRPRDLHVEEAVAAAETKPDSSPLPPRQRDGQAILAEDYAFVVERWCGPQAATLEAPPDQPLWLIPLAGQAQAVGEAILPGEVWLAHGEVAIDLAEDGELLFAHPGKAARERRSHTASIRDDR